MLLLLNILHVEASISKVTGDLILEGNACKKASRGRGKLLEMMETAGRKEQETDGFTNYIPLATCYLK